MSNYIKQGTVEKYATAVAHLFRNPGLHTTSEFSREHKVSSYIVPVMVELGWAYIDPQSKKVFPADGVAVQVEDARKLVEGCNAKQNAHKERRLAQQRKGWTLFGWTISITRATQRK